MYLLLVTLLFSLSTLLAGQIAPQPTINVTVASVAIANDSLVSSENVQQIQQEITKDEYGTKAEDEIAGRVRSLLQKDGYFKAEVSTSDLQVLGETPGQRTVAVTLRIDEGRQYRLGRIAFINNAVFPSSQLRQRFAIKDGDIFDVEKIRLGINELRYLYATEGYINFTPVPDTKANDQSGTIGLVVNIDEGKQFKIEGLILRGREEWPEKEAEQLQAIWRPYAGGIFRPELIDQLRTALLAMFPALDFNCDTIEIQRHADRNTVDISIARPANR